jgi:chemotaxis protein methyltransferase CheR
LSAAEFTRLRALVHRLTGIALADTKRELLYTRIVRRVRARGLHSFSEYCQLLESGSVGEVQELANAITTNLTAFFRENHHFLQLAEEALPLVMQAREHTRRLRFWCAGCSTGEEPYSLAITLRECLPDIATWNVRILATDIASNVLQTGIDGRYLAERLRDMPSWRRDRWFAPTNPEATEFAVAAALRDLIVFKQLNLLDAWRMRGPFDVIFCRNVIIYFDKATQRRLFERMAQLQQPGGWLFIGHSENLSNLSDCYELVGRSAYRRV